jgi:hypothetical protein
LDREKIESFTVRAWLIAMLIIGFISPLFIRGAYVAVISAL